MKTLFLTGGNNGIGFYMVKEWLERGNSAAAIDLSCDNLIALKKRHKDRLIPIECDARSADDMKKAAQTANVAYGGIDCAVHNACVCPFKSFDMHTPADYEDVMSVNLLGAVNLAKAVLPFMAAQGSGRICFTSSGVGVTGFANISSYAASKGALESLAKCLNIEYKNSGVTFHLLHPPLTDTKSSSPLPVPKEFKASPESVGKGLIRRMGSRKFIITPSPGSAFSVRMTYLFPLSMGRFLAKMTGKAAK
jgi:gluconate 5-dehydrogenase